MLRVTCAAACGNFELCLIACPQNANLAAMAPPTCEPAAEKRIDDEEKLIVVVEEETKRD